MTEERKYHVLKAGSYVAELVQVERGLKMAPHFVDREYKGLTEQDMVSFRYMAEDAENKAMVFSDVKPFFKSEKATITKHIVALNSGAGMEFVGDDTALDWLKSKVGEKVLITVKNYESKTKGHQHGFKDIAALPASMKALMGQKQEEPVADHPNDIDFDTDDIPF